MKSSHPDNKKVKLTKQGKIVLITVCAVIFGLIVFGIAAAATHKNTPSNKSTTNSNYSSPPDSNTNSGASQSSTTGSSSSTTSVTSSTTNSSTSCHPLADSGNCYEPGEYCRDSDHGASGVAGDGESITCEDNNGWRWEPS